MAVQQVLRAARLDASEAQALSEAVAAAEIAAEPQRDGRGLADDVGSSEQQVADGDTAHWDPFSDSELGEDTEEPDIEAFRGTDHVGDFEAARSAARRVLEVDRRRANPQRRILTAEEEVGLCLLYRGREEISGPLPDGYTVGLPREGEAHRALSAMIAHNQRLVHKILRDLGHRPGGPMYEDLVQHGAIGVMRAVEKFDVTLGCKFSTYATCWIRQRITRAIANEGTSIRLPVHMRVDVEKVRRAERACLDQGLKPNVDDLALACEMSSEKVAKCLQLSRRVVLSLEQPVSADTTLGELVVDAFTPVPGPEQVLWPVFARQEILNLFDSCPLSERSRKVLLLRYGFVDGTPWTLEEIGKEFGVTRERIRQLEKWAFKDLRVHLGLEPDDPASERRRRRAVCEMSVAGSASSGGSDGSVRDSYGWKAPPRNGGCEQEVESSADGEEGAVTSVNIGFGRWMAERMRIRGWDAVEAGRRLAVPQATVEAWLNGSSEPPPELLARAQECLEAESGADGSRATPEQPANDMSQVVWYHRPGHDDGGREFGNAAAFAFEADVEVLAREATQNSLDERVRCNDRPVRVSYTLHELTGDFLTRFCEAIHWDDLLPHFEAAAAQDQKVGRAIRAGLREMMDKDRLVLLRVDDYNANGLTGDDYEDGRFAAVVRRQLDSRKSDLMAGGSYGLGKATLWSTSRLGLVLINSTLCEPHEGRTERRFIGRLDLPWREVAGKRYAGPAWLGRPDDEAGNGEVARSWWADEATAELLHLTRGTDEPGTSFLIVGAHDVASLTEVGQGTEGDAGDDEDSLERMHRRLVQALGRNFWAAMTSGGDHQPLLEASVRSLRNGAEFIAEEKVEPEVHQPARTRALRAFLCGTTVDRITEEEQVACTTVPLKVPEKDGTSGTAGEHRAVLLVTRATDTDGKPNRVTAMRGNRMTVKVSHVPGLPIGTNPFQAVLLAGLAAGPDAPFAAEAEEFLRTSEPPEHNKWGQTEELRMRYSPSAHRRIAALTTETNRAVHALVAIRQEKKLTGAGKVSRRLKVSGKPSPRAVGVAERPRMDDLEAVVDPTGAWRITAEVRLPPRAETWRMTPVAKLEVRSGPRPVVDWAELVAISHCELDDGVLCFTPGSRRAVFRGVTDVSSHPVRAALTGLVVELQEGRWVGA
nr:sigma-70 family RNA polymerase sigma factor [Streptomyces cacaoi]